MTEIYLSYVPRVMFGPLCSNSSFLFPFRPSPFVVLLWLVFCDRPLRCSLLTLVYLRPGARSNSDRCPTFCYGFRFERHVSWNGVQRGSRYVFSCLVGVSKMSAQSAATYINHAVLKRQLAQWVQVKSFIRRHVCRKSFIVKYQHDDDDEFVSKCN